MNRQELTRLNSELRELRSASEPPIHLYADSFNQGEEFSWMFIAHNLGKVTLHQIEVILLDNGYKNGHDPKKTNLSYSGVLNENRPPHSRRVPTKYVYKDIHAPYEPTPAGVYNDKFGVDLLYDTFANPGHLTY